VWSDSLDQSGSLGSQEHSSTTNHSQAPPSRDSPATTVINEQETMRRLLCQDDRCRFTRVEYHLQRVQKRAALDLGSCQPALLERGSQLLGPGSFPCDPKLLKNLIRDDSLLVQIAQQVQGSGSGKPDQWAGVGYDGRCHRAASNSSSSSWVG
jgi:hypothetical protein